MNTKFQQEVRPPSTVAKFSDVRPLKERVAKKKVRSPIDSGPLFEAKVTKTNEFLSCIPYTKKLCK